MRRTASAGLVIGRPRARGREAWPSPPPGGGGPPDPEVPDRNKFRPVPGRAGGCCCRIIPQSNKPHNPRPYSESHGLSRTLASPGDGFPNRARQARLRIGCEPRSDCGWNPSQASESPAPVAATDLRDTRGVSDTRGVWDTRDVSETRRL